MDYIIVCLTHEVAIMPDIPPIAKFFSISKFPKRFHKMIKGHTFLFGHLKNAVINN